MGGVDGQGSLAAHHRFNGGVPALLKAASTSHCMLAEDQRGLSTEPLTWEQSADVSHR